MRATLAALRRDPPVGLIVAILVYVLLRGLILYTAFDETAMEMFELYPMGTLPKVLLEGGRIPLRFYYDNAAGQILTGLVAVPYYLVFGETYLALKLVPATFGLGALILTWIFLNGSFSRTAANAGALLFAVGPTTTLAKYSLMASGNHFENLFFTLLVLVCFYRLHAVRPEQRGRWLVATGIAAGFSIFVFLGALIPVGLLALCHLGVRGWRGFGRDLARLVPAFVIGLGPLLYLNLAAGGQRGLDFLTRRFGEGQKRESSVLPRVREFLLEELPRAGFFDSLLGMTSRVANLAFTACFAIAWLAALGPALRGGVGLALGCFAGGEREERDEARRFRAARLVPLVFYIPLTALAYGVSDLELANHTPPIECAGYRYFLPTFLFAVLLIAIFFGETRDAFSSFGRRLGVLVFGLALLTGAWNLSYVDFGLRVPNLGAHYVGHNFVQAARGLLNPDNELTDEQARAYADDFEPLLRHRLYTGFGFFKANQQWIERKKHGREEPDYLDLDRLLDGWPAEMHVDMLRGAGSFTRFQHLVGRPGLTLAVLETLAARGDPRAAHVAEGASTNKEYPQAFLRTKKNLGDALVTLKEARPELQPDYARGCGILCGRLLRREIAPEIVQVDQFAHAVPAALTGELLFGMGIGLADGGEEPAVPESTLALVPKTRRTELLAGFGARSSELFGPDEARARAEALPEELRAGVLAGISR